jgi:sarcosine oxidase subunit alpha
MSLGAMAVGYHDHPQVSPLYHTQLAHGGNSLRMGSWIRMVDFGDHEAESLAVHSTAGICDVSMFGKFRVFGPDAEKLLNRIMTRNIEKLNGNSTFYYTACNEEGVLVDDGMALKMGEHDYFVTTTAARAAVTEEWLARWCREENIVSRVGFVGELNYELFCPASQGPYLWDAIMAAGKPLGLVPFGIECLNICRLEKGHVLPGIDTDSFTNLFEASMGWALDRNKTETVGKAMLDLTTHQAIKERVIAFSIEGRSPVSEGALVVDGTQQLGRVTSIIYSPLLKKTIGFALVAPHDNWVEGGTVTFWYDSGREAQASFAKPPFYDPKGQRIRM